MSAIDQWAARCKEIELHLHFFCLSSPHHPPSFFFPFFSVTFKVCSLHTGSARSYAKWKPLVVTQIDCSLFKSGLCSFPKEGKDITYKRKNTGEPPPLTATFLLLTFSSGTELLFSMSQRANMQAWRLRLSPKSDL